MHARLTNQNTERLSIRMLTENDIDSWELFLKDTDVFEYYPSTMQYNENYAHDWITKQIQRYQDEGFGLMALIDKESGVLIGQCGLIRQKLDGLDEVEIGYHIRKEYRGNGYATEAAKHFKKVAFNQLFLDSVISIIHPENIASQMVASRNGMTKEKSTLWQGMKSFVYRVAQ
ncbi:MAG: GNAT family N-acetyltransferase [Crocinitomicaceae bacterium]|nr:GNAT family N-acetyltransferase [Crocinitomicaceae bacterium]MBT6515605.1 GNAT family N-acetyltransferase [Crocinitomicaceae bacterium]